jgi:hypothetical protein
MLISGGSVMMRAARHRVWRRPDPQPIPNPKELRMKRLALVIALLAATPAVLAAAKTYQVTGTVVELRDDAIVVEKKDKEKWEVGRDATVKVKGDLKKGSKVTIEYRMNATGVEVK